MPESDEGKGRVPLVLDEKDFAANTAALYEELERDPAARERFIENPTGDFAEKVLGRVLPRQRQSDANRLLYSLLANEKFSQWLAEYPGEKEADANAVGGISPREAEFQRDFMVAVVEHGDENILGSLVKHAADGFGIPISDLAQQFITGPQQTFAFPAATPSTSNQSAHSSQNFNAFAFGDPSVVDPALMRALVEDVAERARQLAESGRLADLESEI